MNKSLFIYYGFGVFFVLMVSWVSFYVFLKHGFKRLKPWLYLLIFSSVYMLLFQYLKYLSLHFYADFSHWIQIVYSLTKTLKPLCYNQELIVPGTINYFSAHFVPLIYVFAIPFKIWPYSSTLIIFNFLFMVSAAIPLYKLAFLRDRDKTFALFAASLLLWYPTFQYTVLYEFEMLRFSIPFIFWMLLFLKQKRLGLYFFFVLLAILVREEVGLTVMMFGLYLFFVEKERWIGAVTAVSGLAAFLIIAGWIMPHLNKSAHPQHVASYWFYAFGQTPDEISRNIFLNPKLTLTTILQPLKLANLFMLFLPLLFIPVLAPAVLLATIANLGVGLLSGAATHSSYMLYYVSPSLPFIFYAFIKAWPRFIDLLENKTKRLLINEKRTVESAARGAVLGGLLTANIFFGPSFIALQFWSKNLRPAPFRTQDFHYSAYRVTEHHRKVEEFVMLIPDTAIVSAEQFLQPRLYKKNGTMTFPQLKSFDDKINADYVFFDKKNPMKTGGGPYPDVWNKLRESPQFFYDWIEKDPEHWKLVKSEDGYFLYERRK